jgi:ubiquinone/menaquinone biosynthesis C-methylase UbiE
VNFNRVARHYHWLETLAFGDTLQRSRTWWIGNVPRPGRALIIGEGNGRFLSELLRVHPGIEIDCVDASDRMLRLARQNVSRADPNSAARVRFLRRDVLSWSPSGSYDLLVTHFFLDLFHRESVQSIVAKLARAAAPNATWLIADFTIPSGRLTGCHAKLWLRAMYLFFKLTAGVTANTLVDPGVFLQRNGFARGSHRSFRLGMVKSELYRNSDGPADSPCRPVNSSSQAKQSGRSQIGASTDRLPDGMKSPVARDRGLEVPGVSSARSSLQIVPPNAACAR